MLCPQCKAKVREGAEICDGCDFILDPSFLGDLGGEPAAPAAPAALARRPGGAPARAAPRAPRPAARAPRAPPPARRAPKPAPAPVEEEEEEEPEPPPPPPRAAPKPQPAPAAPAPGRKLGRLDVEESKFSRETEAMADETWGQLKDLPLGEKVGLGGVLVLFLMMLMPWRSTALEGEELGLTAGTYPAIVAVIVAGGALYMRISAQYRWGLVRLHTLLAQVVAGLVASGTAVVRMILDTDLSMMRNALGSEVVVSSTPHIGAPIALLAGLCIAGAAFGAWKDPDSF